MIYDISDIRVIDGDTIKCNVRINAFKMSWYGSIRLLAVLAPELRSKDPDKKRIAVTVKIMLTDFFDTNRHGPMIVIAEKMDSFGRLLGEVIVDGTSVNDLINEWLKYYNEKAT